MYAASSAAVGPPWPLRPAPAVLGVIPGGSDWGVEVPGVVGLTGEGAVVAGVVGLTVAGAVVAGVVGLVTGVVGLTGAGVVAGVVGLVTGFNFAD